MHFITLKQFSIHVDITFNHKRHRNIILWNLPPISWQCNYSQLKMINQMPRECQASQQQGFDSPMCGAFLRWHLSSTHAKTLDETCALMQVQPRNHVWNPSKRRNTQLSTFILKHRQWVELVLAWTLTRHFDILPLYLPPIYHLLLHLRQ